MTLQFIATTIDTCSNIVTLIALLFTVFEPFL